MAVSAWWEPFALSGGVPWRKVAPPKPQGHLSFADQLRLAAAAGDGDFWTTEPKLPILDDESSRIPATSSSPCVWPETALIDGVLGADECNKLISLFEAMPGGFQQGRSVASGPETQRKNEVLVWICPQDFASALWKRVEPAVQGALGGRGLNLNLRFRCYRYKTGDVFLPHHDGSQYPSELRGSEQQLFEAKIQRSQHSLLIYLNGGEEHPTARQPRGLRVPFNGGATALFVNGDNSEPVRVSPFTGSALCFPHGDHPMSLLHSGEAVQGGVKYVIRTDIFS